MNCDEFNKWIEESKPYFEEISKYTGLRLGFDTHYDALNFEFSAVKGKAKHRLDFQPMETGVFYITKYVDTFPFSPNICSILHSVIPMFPYLAKIEHHKFGEISKTVKGYELKESVMAYIKNAF